LGSFRWLINLWFILLTPSTLLYVGLTFLHNHTSSSRFAIRGGTTGVGDSPRGPLKQLGNPHLKPANEPKPSTPHLSTQGMAHATVALTAHRSGPLKDPLEQASPRSRAHASPGRAPSRSRESASLERAPPRSRVRAALEQAPPRSRAFRARTPDPVRGYGHLML
jgi:hypothetical protein